VFAAREWQMMMENSRRPALSGEKLGMPALLFDLDGTLVDSVYEHVASWSDALRSEGILPPNWKIHRHVGMSGGSFLRKLLREIRPRGKKISIDRLEKKHDINFGKIIDRIEVLPGAQQLLRHLSKVRVQWAIATTGNKKHTARLLKKFYLPSTVPVITGDDVAEAKPAPDVFVAAAQRLGVSVSDSVVIGDSVWDLLAAGRKNGLGVGLLCGGYGQQELEGAGAFRVYQDPADMLAHIEDLGIPGE
jgi:HAD superfamily hydrolase (TIGR01509 family)